MELVVFLLGCLLGSTIGQQFCTPTEEQITDLRNDVQAVENGVQNLIDADPGLSIETQRQIIVTICSQPLRTTLDDIETKVKGCLGLISAPNTGLANLTLGSQKFTDLFLQYRNVKHFCDCATTQALVFTMALQNLSTTLMPLASANIDSAVNEMCSGSKATLEQVRTDAVDCPNLKDILAQTQIGPLELSAVTHFTSSDTFCSCVPSILCVGDVDEMKLDSGRNASYSCSKKTQITCGVTGSSTCGTQLSAIYASFTSAAQNKWSEVNAVNSMYCDAILQSTPGTGVCADMLAEIRGCMTSSDDSGDGCQNRACINNKLANCNKDVKKYYLAIVGMDTSNGKVANDNTTCGASMVSVSMTMLFALIILVVSKIL